MLSLFRTQHGLWLANNCTNAFQVTTYLLHKFDTTQLADTLIPKRRGDMYLETRSTAELTSKRLLLELTS